MTRWVEDLQSVVGRRRTVEQRTEAAIAEWLRYLREQQDWFILFIEFWGHAVKEPVLRDRFASQSSRPRLAVAELIAASAAD